MISPGENVVGFAVFVMVKPWVFWKFIGKVFDVAVQPKNKPLSEPEEQIQHDEIKVIDKRKIEEPTQVESVEHNVNDSRKIHKLGDEDDDVLSRNINNDNNPIQNTSSEKYVNPYQPTTKVYDNPFNNDDDDDNIGITSYVKDVADTQTMVEHKVKTQNAISQATYCITWKI